jgi:hypothetical protein
VDGREQRLVDRDLGGEPERRLRLGHLVRGRLEANGMRAGGEEARDGGRDQQQRRHRPDDREGGQREDHPENAPGRHEVGDPPVARKQQQRHPRAQQQTARNDREDEADEAVLRGAPQPEKPRDKRNPGLPRPAHRLQQGILPVERVVWRELSGT